MAKPMSIAETISSVMLIPLDDLFQGLDQKFMPRRCVTVSVEIVFEGSVPLSAQVTAEMAVCEFASGPCASVSVTVPGNLLLLTDCTQVRSPEIETRC